MTEYKVKKKKLTYEEGIGDGKYKDGGVNKLLIIGLVENVAESHSNFEKILNILKLNDSQYLCAFDMKLANIYFEIESAATTHPCSWFKISKEKIQDFQTHGELRTLESIRSSVNSYKTVCKDFF